MAASFSDLGVIAGDPGFQKRVYYAATVAAVNVYSESPTTQGHPARVDLAVKVLNGGFSVFAFALSVLTNATIAAEAVLATGSPGYSIPDGDIQFAVNSLWNAWADA